MKKQSVKYSSLVLVKINGSQTDYTEYYNELN